MSISRAAKTSAFGVEPGYAPFRLRQARYQALGEDIATLAQEHRQMTGRPLDLLDVGCGDGLTMRYVEPHPGAADVRYHGVDRFTRGTEEVYKVEQWRLRKVDLERGMPQVDSDRYDVVVCEQVLEHLHGCEGAIDELVRVVRPGGLLIVGVPIFPHGVHLLRRHLVPRMDRILGVKKVRGHVQAFSKATFCRLLEETGELKIEEVRGFRVVSGGPLRPLEYCRWWWQLNRRIGAAVPSLCVEIQVLARKRPRAAQAAMRRAA
jgi:2-polyprenyl-3-methyl-5-hydroxy-6-metoxy-1,4-benzoquinol methylase